MAKKRKITSLISLAAANLLAVFAKSPKKPNPDDLKNADYTTSTRRLGVRFNEKIRNVFRRRWLRRR